MGIYARNAALDATGTPAPYFVGCATLGSSVVRTQKIRQCNAVVYLQLLLAAVDASHRHPFYISMDCFVLKRVPMLGCANSVASMMFEIWTRHESELAQAQDSFWFKRKVAEWQQSNTPYTRAGVRMMFSFYRQESNSQKGNSPSFR